MSNDKSDATRHGGDPDKVYDWESDPESGLLRKHYTDKEARDILSRQPGSPASAGTHNQGGAMDINYSGFGGTRRPTDGPMPTKDELWPPKKEKPKKRVFMWFFLAVQALFIILIVTGIAGNANDPEMSGEYGDAYAAGTAIGVGLLFILWFIVDMILGVSYAIYRWSSNRR